MFTTASLKSRLLILSRGSGIEPTAKDKCNQHKRITFSGLSLGQEASRSASIQKARVFRSSRPICQVTATATATAQGKMTTYNISITSDVVCPWCYIGHTRLHKAIHAHQKLYPNDKFTLTYRPFYLAPAAQVRDPSLPAFPTQSMPKLEYYNAKFGVERTKGMRTMMTETMKREGISFKFGGRTGSSRNAHRLVHFAQGKGESAQNAVMLGLWRRYFEQEIDITELDVLIDTGLEAKLGTSDQIREYLVSGKDALEVDQLAEEARLEGISGVPFYVVQNLWAVEGAQEPRAFENLFLKWKDLEKKAASTSTSSSNANASANANANAAAGDAGITLKGDSCL